MGEEFLEIEYKFLLITLDKIMKTDDLYQLRSMFSHAADRLELIFRTRYKKLLEKDIVKLHNADKILGGTDNAKSDS